MNDYLIVFIIIIYLAVGTFVDIWMNENYFDAKLPEGKNSDDEVWRAVLWPILLPFVWHLVRQAKGWV